MWLLIPVLGVAYLWYVSRRQRPQTQPGTSLDYAITDTVAPPQQQPPPFVGPPSPTNTGSASTDQPSGSVLCPPTATEKTPVTVALVESSVQPKMQSLEKQTEARALAPQLDAALKANPYGPDYATNLKKRTPARDPALVDLVKRFQSAVGFSVDGLYGPSTAGALMFYLGGQPPPPPFFYSGARVIRVFRPAS